MEKSHPPTQIVESKGIQAFYYKVFSDMDIV